MKWGLARWHQRGWLRRWRPLRPSGRPPATNFVQQLRALEGREVMVATTCGVLRGTLQRVLSDSLLLSSRGGEQHVRFDQICFTAVTREGG